MFVAVVDAGSFSAAGRRLKLSTSVVSHHISKLEGKLGVTLLFRSTRSLSLTSEGEAILPAARRMVQAGAEALDANTDDSDQPVGSLRITMPAFGDQSAIHRCVWDFAKTYPMVAIALQSSDEQVDLVKEGYDLAIRLGMLRDSSLKSRRVGTFERVLVGARDYFDQMPPVRTFEDLNRCQFVSISMLSDTIVLERNGERVEFLPDNAQLEVNSIASAVAAVRAGVGIQHLPLSEIEDELQSGELVEAMPGWKLPTMGVYAVWPDVGPQKKLTRRFIDALVSVGDEIV